MLGSIRHWVCVYLYDEYIRSLTDDSTRRGIRSSSVIVIMGCCVYMFQNSAMM